MLEFLRQFAAGLLSAWERLSTSARATVAVAFLFTAAAIALAVYVGSRPQYVELFSNVSPQDMLAVQGRLEQASVPYRIDSTGTTISVPIQHRSNMRVEILGAGLVKSQGTLPGYELFDTANLMQTQFTQDINYQRALAGELQRLLNEFAFVRNSYVSIREARDELFTSEQKHSEANVTLDVAAPLTEEQVKAVLNTVATFGGAKLSRDHINLVTVDGRILHAPTETDFDSVATSKLELARAYRNDLKREAESALARFGVRSVVTVALDIDHSSRKETKEQVSKGTEISRYTTKNSTISSESAPTGPAGARANLPADAQEAGGQQTNQTETMSIENMEPSRTTTETITTPGEVEVIGATVIVESKYEDEVDEQGNPTGRRQPTERTREELAQYQDLVATAVGVSSDKIKVSDHPFELQDLAVPAGTPAAAAVPASRFSIGMVQLNDVLKIVAVIVLFFIVRFLALRATVRREQAEEEISIDLPKASPEELRKREIATEVERVSQEQPEAVASLLRTWLNEPEE